MSTPFLITGTTGGLGAKVLKDLLTVHNIPPQDIIATSRSDDNRERYESQGLQFRPADYERPETLAAAFQNVENLLFMSSSERDTPKRNREHANVVEAAVRAKVGRVWYVSLAFGGYGDASTISFQLAHYETENLLKNSGLSFISLRAGVYAEAFPLFLNWYPSSTSVLLPTITPTVSGSRIAFATRDELGEAIATLLARGLSSFPAEVQPKMAKNIILLTGAKAESLVELVGAINRARGGFAGIPIEYLQPQEWIDACAADDVGGKGRAWFESRLGFTRSVSEGDAELVDPALETILGRRPESGTEAVERLVRSDPGYTWHQNHAR